MIPYSVPLTPALLRTHTKAGAKVFARYPAQCSKSTIYTLDEDAFAEGGLVFAWATDAAGYRLMLEFDPMNLENTFIILTPDDYAALAHTVWKKSPETQARGEDN